MCVAWMDWLFYDLLGRIVWMDFPLKIIKMHGYQDAWRRRVGKILIGSVLRGKECISHAAIS